VEDGFILSCKTGAVFNQAKVEMLMKSKSESILTIVVIALIWLIPLTAQAAGPHDGFWKVNEVPNMIISFNQSGDEVVVLTLLTDTGQWNALTGQAQGAQVEVSYVISVNGVTAVYLIEFTSATTATNTLTSCSPAPACFFEQPINVPFLVTKIF
jgi:hypothetical protein